MRRLAEPLCACVIGCLLLGLLFSRVHANGEWDVWMGRSEAIQRARIVAASQGVPAESWRAYVTSQEHKKFNFYRRNHPEDKLAQPFSAILAQVVLASPDPNTSFSVSVAPNGSVASWDWRNPALPGPEGGPPPGLQDGPAPSGKMRPRRLPPPGPPAGRPAPPEFTVMADQAFHVLTGPSASMYRATTVGASTREGLRYTWEPAAAPGHFQPTVDVVVNRGGVIHAETHVAYSHEFEAEYSAATQAQDIFELGYYVILFLIVLGASIYYTLGSVRRRVDHRFAMWLAAAVLCFIAASKFLGNTPDAVGAAAALAQDSAGSGWFEAAMSIVSLASLAWVVAGGGLYASRPFREKWWSLRLLVSRKLFSKQVGLALAAGVLFAPALACLPVVAGAIWPKTVWSLDSFEAYWSPLPLAELLRNPFHPLDLGFFGVVAAITIARVRRRWLAYAIVAVLGILFFSGQGGSFQDSALASVFAGALVCGAVFEILRRFDLLAVLTATTGKGLLLAAAPLLLEPSTALHPLAWRILSVLLLTLGAGAIALWIAPDRKYIETDQDEGATHSQREQLQAEFQIAQRAQREMLPANAPAAPGFSIAAHCTPAKEVGGDLYDFLRLGEDRLGIVVADVSGKGVPAALYMTLTKGLLAATSQEDLPLAQMLDHINGHLYTVGRRKTFVTMAMGVLDPVQRTFEHARAGHNPTVWRRASTGATSFLSPKGMGLGITGGAAFRRTLAIEKLDLEAGDMLVLYSDGLTEAMNRELEQFGEERLAQVVGTLDGLSAADARDRILAEVASFLRGNHPQDDLTLVVVRVD